MARATTKQTSKARRRGGARDLALRIITICLIGIALVSAWYVGKALWQYYTARQNYKEIADTAKVDPDQFTGVVDFEALWAINPDVVGWIYQKDTIINYPVLQGEDNDEYLYTNLQGEYSNSGSIFLDSRNTKDFSDFHSIIYGHHMHDGSMFKSIRGYTKEDGYYDTHKSFELITPENKYHLLVFSAYITEATGDAYTVSFADSSAEASWLSQVIQSSEITTDEVSVTAEDRIVMLSTCAYDFDEARYVVFCKMVPWTEEEIAEGEALQAKIDAQEKA